MKVAISAISEDLKQTVNPVFGRCPGYIIAEIEGKEVKSSSFMPNPAMETAMGAGTAAARAVAEQGAEAVITGNVGPNAFIVLQQTGIKVYKATGLSVQQAIQQLAEGKLKEMAGSSVSGHFGMGAGRGSGRSQRRGRGAGRSSGTGRGMGAGKGRSSPV